MKKITELLYKIPYRWPLTVVSAFVGMISFFSINSAFADKHHVNGLFTIAGIVLVGFALLMLIAAGIESEGHSKE